MNLCDINTIKPLLSRHGFRFSKSMGQNFLIENWVPLDIAAASGTSKECGVLEIGPGIGPLTQRLAERAGKVVSVELDKALLPVLSETLSEFSNVEIISGDILKQNISALVDERLRGFTPIACANLPYNITTPVISALLDAKQFRSITVMIQREVAHRICAAPGTSDYGAFSLFCQYYAACEVLFDVPPTCFLPAPKVTSSVIQLVPYERPPANVENEALFFSVIKASFAQRRKTLLNGLTAAFGSRLTKEQLRQILNDCEFDEDIRGEKLGIPEFTVLTNYLNRTGLL
jgi:16S rRNA (adenine1518-N6/adenine1519-N6)-dimethyltransferase